MTRAKDARFVKAANTQTPVSSSQRELERILRRYGATGLTLSSDWSAQLARIAFRVPDSPAPDAVIVPVRLEVSMRGIADALGYYRNGRIPTQHGWEQVERVAWRHLVLWVDAACSAAGAGLQTMSEAFLAHMLVRAPDGEIKKVSAMLDEAAAAQGGSGYRALLPATT